MKRFLYGTLGCILLPFLIILYLIYGICKAIQFLCNKYENLLEIFMRWIDKNITPNI